MAGNVIKPLSSMNNLSSGARNGNGEVLTYTYYDTHVLATGQQEQRMFSTPLGQGSPPKTPSQTNMKLASQIPQGQRLTVQEIIFQYYTGAAAIPETLLPTINQFFWDSTVVFKMPGKDDFGIWKLSEIFGQCFNVAVLPSVAGDNINVPFGLNTAKKTLSVPVVLPSLETFEFVISNDTVIPAGLNGHEIYVGLSGGLERMS